MTATPTGALTQPQQALEAANTVRLRNSQTKRDIAKLPRRDGYRAAAELLTDPDGPAGTLQVVQLLNAIYGVSDSTSGPLLTQAEITDPRRQIRNLTPRRRAALARLLKLKALS